MLLDCDNDEATLLSNLPANTRYTFVRLSDVIAFEKLKHRPWPYEYIQTFGVFRDFDQRIHLHTLFNNASFDQVKFTTDTLPYDGCVAQVYGTFQFFDGSNIVDPENVEPGHEMVFKVYIWKEIKCLKTALDLEELLYKINKQYVH